MRGRLVKILLILLIVFGLLGARTAFAAKKAFTSLSKASGAFQLQDLAATKAYLADTKRDFESTKKTLIVFTPLRIIPLFGWYVADAQRGVNAAIEGVEAAIILTDAMTPYADVLGFEGEGTFLGGTAQERLAKAVETLAIISPQIDSVGENLKAARDQIDKIQSWRYPNFLPGKPGQKIDLAKNSIDQIETFVVDAKPLLEVLPGIMGQHQEKKYLVLFQNDAELRPTGGFITAYAVFRVNKGIMEPEGSSDIYKLDETLTKRIPAPAPILAYLPNVPTLNLRDSNLSPDFASSMTAFESLYEFTRDKKDIDGIIALDTQFVESMMQVLGDIEVDGDKFTTEKIDACNCPQIVYELERYADEPVAFEKGDRKGIIGVLMQSMIDKAFNAPKSSWPNLLGTTIEAIREKHLLMYMKDPKTQEALEKVNFAGRIYEYDGDYLHINETNFAGAKSNLFVEEKAKLTVKKGKDDTLDKKLVLEYKYPRKMDNCSLERQGGLCLAGIYRDWIRIYVSKGSKIVKAAGLDFSESEDLGKTVFEGFFELRPEGALKIELEYTTPLKVDGQYKLLIQKQGGTAGHTYEIDAFGKRQKPFPLDTDKELIVKL